MRTRRVLALLALLASPVSGQTAASQDSLPTAAPVVLGRDTLFRVQARIGPFAAADRAAAIMRRLEMVTSDPLRANDTISIVADEGGTDVMIGDMTVFTVTEADARAAGMTRQALAEQRAESIRNILERESLWGTLKAVGLGVLFTALASGLLWLILWLMSRMFPVIETRLEQWRSTRMPAIRIQRLELLSAGRLTDLLIAAARIVRIALIVVLVFYFVPLVFSFFPWTAAFADRMFDYLLTPLGQVWDAFISYIPNIFYIAVIVIVTRYGLRFVHLIFNSIERGTLQFSGFHPEWADPTYKIVRFLVLAFALIVIFPYLPGSGSDAFRGVSVFLGVLVSFGSAGAIGNVVAGVVITYMRPFKIGDRVKISDTVGDVIERTLLVTRVRTIKNVDISIPNAMVLASHITNYSSTAAHGGIILHTSVTIGYDAHWKRVHELLLAAAERTDGLMEEKKPFVLQTKLDDFYVEYELNAYTSQPNQMARIYSDLHQHIQDTFAEAGVEIMSPHYRAERDGSAIAIPRRPSGGAPRPEPSAPPPSPETRSP